MLMTKWPFCAKLPCPNQMKSLCTDFTEYTDNHHMSSYYEDPSSNEN